ncbi:hypothetical protein RD792_011652, partial [Penstemon davidsonii]
MAITVQPTKQVEPKKKRRVVVTGLGVVSPLGHDPDEFYTNLLNGINGVSHIETFYWKKTHRIAGEIKNFTADDWVSPKISKRADKFMLYLLTAGKKALVDGGITKQVMFEFDKNKCGVVIGSAHGGMKGWMGPNYSISTACATSNFCIVNAANHFIKGETDLMLCGGSDAAIIPIGNCNENLSYGTKFAFSYLIIPKLQFPPFYCLPFCAISNYEYNTGLGGYIACRALSQRNDDPTKASHPWDMHGDGFVMGEGAGVLLLEELEHAKRRGANIYAEFLRGSFTNDAYHITKSHPDGTGIVLCMKKALAESGVAREDVNYINAHATSTPSADLNEYQAIVRVFGENTKLRMNSTKSMIGHLLGAAGAVEAVATVKAIKTGWIHPNINLEFPGEGL